MSLFLKIDLWLSLSHSCALIFLTETFYQTKTTLNNLPSSFTVLMDNQKLTSLITDWYYFRLTD